MIFYDITTDNSSEDDIDAFNPRFWGEVSIAMCVNCREPKNWSNFLLNSQFAIVFIICFSYLQK